MLIGVGRGLRGTLRQSDCWHRGDYDECQNSERRATHFVRTQPSRSMSRTHSTTYRCEANLLIRLPINRPPKPRNMTIPRAMEGWDRSAPERRAQPKIVYPLYYLSGGRRKHPAYARPTSRQCAHVFCREDDLTATCMGFEADSQIDSPQIVLAPHTRRYDT